jgi:hypothetical protein
MKRHRDMCCKLRVDLRRDVSRDVQLAFHLGLNRSRSSAQLVEFWFSR